MSERNDLLEAVDRARDAAITHLFEVLVANVIGNDTKAGAKFARGLAAVRVAHDTATGQVGKVLPAFDGIGPAVIAELDREGL